MLLQESRLKYIPNPRWSKKIKKISYEVSFNILIVVDISILRNEPNEYFDILLTPILFYSFVLDHSKLIRNVLLDSNVDDFRDHI